MSVPQLVVEVDWTGNPTAGFYDEVHNTTGIVSYWRMNGTSALTDSLGVNTGVIEGTPTLVSGALPYDTDQALSFNGSSNDAYVANSPTISASGSFTVSGWVKFASLPGAAQVIVTKQGSFAVSIDATNKLTFSVRNDNTLTTVTANAPILVNTWYHVAGVHNSSAAQIRLYVNGILHQSASFTLGAEVTAQPLRFAAVPATTSPAYQSSQTATGTGTSITLTKPTSTASGDLLIVYINSGEAVTVTEPDATWNLFINAGTSGQNRAHGYWKIAGGGEPASYTFTTSAGPGTWNAMVSRFTGTDTTAPLADATFGGATVSGTTHLTGTHLPAADNTLLLGYFSCQSNGTWTATAGSGTPTEQVDFNGGAGSRSISLYTLVRGAAASNSMTGTVSVSNVGTAHLIVLLGTGLTYTACQTDDWTFWSGALTSDTIRSHYESRNGGVGAWTNLSSLVMSASGSLQRQYELDKMQAGTASFTFNDAARNLDPANTSSPYYPNVKTGRRIRARLLIAGSYYPLFQGYIQGLPTTWTGPNSAVCTVTATDGFLPQALATVTGTLASAPSGTQIGQLLDRSFWPSADRAIDPGAFTMATNTLAVGAKALTEIQDIGDSELGIYFIDPAGLATFHDYNHRWTQTRSVNSQATFSDPDSGGGITYQDLQPSTDDSKTFNQWIVTSADGTIATATDIEAQHQGFPLTNTRSTRLDNPGDATVQATALLQSTTRPGQRFQQLTVMGTDKLTDTQWATLVGLVISDKVTVKRNPLLLAAGSAINRECFIEGRSWTATPAQGGCFVRFDWQLSPVAPLPYFYMVDIDNPVSYWRMSAVT